MAERHARRTRVLLSDIRFEVERGDSPEILEAASALMRASWPTPSLDYSPELLEWHLGFSGGAEAFCLCGWIGSRCVAFAAATPRLVRAAEWTGSVLVKSFMTVDADLKGRGVGRELRRRIAREIARRSRPVLRFGEALPSVERVLAEDYGDSGLHLRLVGPCIAAAVMARGGGPGAAVGKEEYAAVWRAHANRGVVDPAPSPNEFAHYLLDPRQRTVVGVRERDGELVVAAMSVRATLATRRGVEQHVHLEQVFVGRNARAEHLACLAADAAYWGYEARAGVVTIPNIGDTPWSLLAGAGFRKLPPRYSAWVATATTNHPLQYVGATNVEIV